MAFFVVVKGKTLLSPPFDICVARKCASGCVRACVSAHVCERACVCVNVCEREYESMCVHVCECEERDREKAHNAETRCAI